MINNRKLFCILLFSDVVAVVVAWQLTLLTTPIASDFIKHVPYVVTNEMEELRQVSFFLLAGMALFLLMNKGHYSRRIPWWSQVKYLFNICVILLLVDGFINFSLDANQSRMWVLVTWVFVGVTVLILRLVTHKLLQHSKMWALPTIIIGNNDAIIEVLYAIESEKNATGYHIETLYCLDSITPEFKDSLPVSYANVNITKTSRSKLPSIISKNKQAFQIFCPAELDGFGFDAMLQRLNHFDIKFALVPPVAGSNIYGAVPQLFFGYDVMFLFFRDTIHSPFAKLSKRCIDLIFAFFGILAMVGLYLVLGRKIAADGGPVLFKQKRVGKGGKEFDCYKFRTMCQDGDRVLEEYLDANPLAKIDWDLYRKLNDDPRITKVGNLLRKTSLDEFPQFINVLRGEMSMVGPRPAFKNELDEFYTPEKRADYMAVKPGITGLWQVSGRSSVTFKQRTNYESWYVKNWSLWNDLVIIIKTVGVVLRGSGAR